MSTVHAMTLGLLALALSGCGAGPGAPAAPALPPPEIIKTKLGVEMVRIPAGTFQMGSASGSSDEAPVHTVTLNAFLMDRTEVTQSQFAPLKIPSGSHNEGPQNPAEMISFDKAARFCNARSKAEGLAACYNLDTMVCDFDADGYRLPTEAEWEYACRAGSSVEPKAAESGWVKENAGGKSHAVAQKSPNAWGLYDMLGNVAEWCTDVYAKDYYKTSPKENPRGAPLNADPKFVLRGGAWDTRGESVRASTRAGGDPGLVDACFSPDNVGFRCVRKAP